MKKITPLLLCFAILLNAYQANGMERETPPSQGLFNADLDDEHLLRSAGLILLLALITANNVPSLTRPEGVNVEVEREIPRDQSDFQFFPNELITYLSSFNNIYSLVQFSRTSHRIHNILSSPHVADRIWMDVQMSPQDWTASAIGNQIRLISPNERFNIDMFSRAVTLVLCENPTPRTPARSRTRRIHPEGFICTGCKSRSASPIRQRVAAAEATTATAATTAEVATGIALPLNVEDANSIRAVHPIEIRTHGRIYQAFQTLRITDEATGERIPSPFEGLVLAIFSAQKMVQIGGRIYLAHFWQNEILVIDPSLDNELIQNIPLEGHIRSMVVSGNFLIVGHGHLVSVIDTTQLFVENGHIQELSGDVQESSLVRHSFPVVGHPEFMILLDDGVLLVLCLGRSGPNVFMTNLQNYLR